MDDFAIRRERAQNLWGSFARKFVPVGQATRLEPVPTFSLSQIGGLHAAKEEIQTFAYAATESEIYERWGTHPPTGLLLIGQRSVGKRLLARSLAALTETSFLDIAVPRLVLEVIHRGGNVGELVSEWVSTLSEMPSLTVYFNELEFLQAEEIGARRPDLPVGPVMDFLLDLTDRTVAVPGNLLVGSTSHPDTLRQAFASPGRFERVVEVNPLFPSDIIEALRIHVIDAEKLAGRPLFEDVDWEEVTAGFQHPAAGDWVHILHSVLRRKARLEAGGETVGPVTTQDLCDEVDRYRKASSRIALPKTGNYV
jgi:ATP-dependent 26S proteasome regulatory subunit